MSYFKIIANDVAELTENRKEAMERSDMAGSDRVAAFFDSKTEELRELGGQL